MTNDPRDETDGIDETAESDSVKRRTVLASTAGLATAAVGFGAFAGTAAAWERFDADFKGCSEVWLIVDGQDLNHDPSTVAHVVVGTADGETDCRVVEFTEERATTVPGQYGYEPVVKYAPGDDEKVLAVILYNYIQGATGEDRFEKPSCMLVNDHRCARTRDTADPYESDCVQGAYDGHWDGTYWDDGDCLGRIVDGSGQPRGGPGRSSRRFRSE